MIYLLTAFGLSPGGRSTVHIYTQTIHRTIRNKQYIEQHKNFGRVRAVPTSWLEGEVVNWELWVETGKNDGKVDSLSQWLHTVYYMAVVLNGMLCGHNSCRFL